MSGAKLGDSKLRLLFNADDVLLFISKPKSTIPALKPVSQSFSQIFNYKMDYDKSEALLLGDLRIT